MASASGEGEGFFEERLDRIEEHLGLPPYEPPVDPPPAPGTYTVKAGDTLGSIAARNNVTVDFLVQRNNIDNPNLILVGQVLFLTGEVEPEPEPPAPEPEPEPEPEPQPQPPVGNVPTGAVTLFQDSFESQNFGRWSTIQNKDINGQSANYSGYPAKVTNGGPGHESAARFEVRSGDKPSFGGNRSEVRFPSIANVREGDERWVEFDLMFDRDAFPSPTGWWCLVMQWHAGDGSPPLGLQVPRDSHRLAVVNNRSGGYSRPFADLDRGNWHHYVMRTLHSRGSNGHVQVWRDGALVYDERGATMASDSSYMKFGLYRDDMSATQVVWFDNFRVSRN